jgi:intracellular septation protein A
MKNSKNYLKIILAAMFVLVVFFSCSKDNDIDKTTTIPTVQTPVPSLKCFISGETVTNAETNDAFSTIIPGSTTTYKYNSTFIITIVTWSIVTANPAGSITVNNATNPNASISFAPNFISGTIQAVGNDATGQICGPIMTIKK